MKRIFIILALFFLLLGLSYAVYVYLNTQKIDKNYLTLYGNVDIRQVDLGFRVAGRVLTMPFEEGDFVPQRALMATLDKQPYVDQVRQSEARIESTKTSLANSQNLLERRQSLIGSGAVSKEDVQDTQTSHDVNVANLKEATATLGINITNLQDTELYAPANGTILTRIREPGTIVSFGEPIYTLSLISPIWIRAYVNETQLGDIYPDMPADIYTDRHDGKIYHGHIGFISPVAEFTPKTVETTNLRTDLVYRLRIIADNPDEGLRQGMPVTVKLPLRQHSSNAPSQPGV
jgi:HlyD family secretion protein